MTAWFYMLIWLSNINNEILTPINTSNRELIETIELTQIGEFGIVRKARPKVQRHLHTGIDIKRPSNNYVNEFIYPISKGIVISKRVDGPYAQLIIEHKINRELFWTVYEHIAGIQVDIFQPVNPEEPIARFFNIKELDTHGWQFDHFHFEVLKKSPNPIKPNEKNPERSFSSHSLVCFTTVQLNQYFYDPIQFLTERL